MRMRMRMRMREVWGCCPKNVSNATTQLRLHWVGCPWVKRTCTFSTVYTTKMQKQHHLSYTLDTGHFRDNDNCTVHNDHLVTICALHLSSDRVHVTHKPLDWVNRSQCSAATPFLARLDSLHNVRCTIFTLCGLFYTTYKSQISFWCIPRFDAIRFAATTHNCVVGPG